MLEVNESNFDSEVLGADRPVIVDFWGEGCAPCKAALPVLEALAVANADKVSIVKLNVQEATPLAIKYGIRSIPTLIVFNGGYEVKRGGFSGKAGVQALIDEVVGL